MWTIKLKSGQEFKVDEWSISHNAIEFGDTFIDGIPVSGGELQKRDVEYVRDCDERLFFGDEETIEREKKIEAIEKSFKAVTLSLGKLKEELIKHYKKW